MKEMLYVINVKRKNTKIIRYRRLRNLQSLFRNSFRNSYTKFRQLHKMMKLQILLKSKKRCLTKFVVYLRRCMSSSTTWKTQKPLK